MANKKIRVYPSWVVFSLIFLIFALLSFNSISQIILGKELQDVDMNFLTKHTEPIWFLGVFLFFFFKVFSSKLNPNIYTIYRKNLTVIPKEHGFVFTSVYQVPKQLRMGTERHNLNLPILRIGPQITIGYVLCNPTVFYLHLEDIQKIGEKGIFSEEALLGHILDLVNREILHDFKNADSIDDAPEKVFSVGQRKEVSLDGKMFPLTVINEEDRSKNGKVHICIVSIEMT